MLDAARLDIARSAIKKMNDLDALSSGPNKVYMDLFGLDESAKAANKASIEASTLTADQKARIIILE